MYKFENFAFFYDFILNNFSFFKDNKTIEHYKWLGDSLQNCNCQLKDKIIRIEEIYLKINDVLTNEEISKIKEKLGCQELEFWNNENFICKL